MTEQTLLKLLTFAPMIDSEIARLVLRHYRVEYLELDHLFGWVSLLALLHGGSGQVPLLYGRGVRLTGPRAIVEHFDSGRTPEERLLPREEPLRGVVEEDWNRYDGSLAADVAAVCYFYMLPRREVMSELFARSLPRLEARLVPAAYPALRRLFSVLLPLTRAQVDEALLRIRATFVATDRRIADGRRFLAGDRLTLGDLALAGAAAPLLLPAKYSAPVPAFHQMPAPLQTIVSELRLHPTAAFIITLYETL